MVSSALKREHLLIQAAKRARALDKLDTSLEPTIYLLPLDGSGEATPPLIIENIGVNTFSRDPRPALRSLLGYLSDVELARLIATRLAQAEPAHPPLYLRAACIEGFHDFLLPTNGSHYISPPPMASTDTNTGNGICTSSGTSNNTNNGINTSNDKNPINDLPNVFSKVPVTRQDPNGLSKAAGAVTPPPIAPIHVRDNCASLLVSIATLLSFLSPTELRQLLLKRIDDSQHPYKGVACFLEFMQSGSDGVPKGKTAMKVKAAKRARIAAFKRSAKETSGGSTSIVNVPISQHSDPFMESTVSQARQDTSTLQSYEYDVLDTNDELEDGELPFSILSSSTSAAVPPTLSDRSIMATDDSKSLKKINGISDAVQKSTPTTDDEPKSTPKKRKRKRKSKPIMHLTVSDVPS